MGYFLLLEWFSYAFREYVIFIYQESFGTVQVNTACLGSDFETWLMYLEIDGLGWLREGDTLSEALIGSPD